MKRVSKHKLGFSLVEMVLVLAIICLLGGIVGGLCLAMSNSFITTYNIDDSSDYAMLFARGFENSFLAKTQKAGASNVCTWYVNGSTSISGYPTLRVQEGSTSTAVFEPQFLGGADGTYKWNMLMYYKWDEASERVLYCLLLKDNKLGTDFTYFYQGGFWVPRFTDRKIYNEATSRSIAVSGEEMTSGTLTAHGFNATQIPPDLLSAGYMSTITYTA